MAARTRSNSLSFIGWDGFPWIFPALSTRIYSVTGPAAQTQTGTGARVRPHRRRKPFRREAPPISTGHARRLFAGVPPVVNSTRCIRDSGNLASDPQRQAALVMTPPGGAQVRWRVQRSIGRARLPSAQDLCAARKHGQAVVRTRHQRFKGILAKNRAGWADVTADSQRPGCAGIILRVLAGVRDRKVLALAIAGVCPVVVGIRVAKVAVIIH